VHAKTASLDMFAPTVSLENQRAWSWGPTPRPSSHSSGLDFQAVTASRCSKSASCAASAAAKAGRAWQRALYATRLG
jgi:hypothetical protein